MQGPENFVSLHSRPESNKQAEKIRVREPWFRFQFSGMGWEVRFRARREYLERCSSFLVQNPSHAETITTYKPGFNQNYYTFALILLMKIVLFIKSYRTRFIVVSVRLLVKRRGPIK